MTSWNNLSIAKKLYLVVGVMAFLIAGELLTLRFSLQKLSAVRAFVEGEGTWSKAQKDSVFSLQRYAVTHDEKDYGEFLGYLRVPEGDHRARIELGKAKPDLREVRDGFLQGKIHPDDIDAMVDLLQKFYWVTALDRAIHYWVEADGLLDQLKEAGASYRRALTAVPPDLVASRDAFGRIRTINQELTGVEENFSRVLGEGARWLEHVVISLLFLAVLMVESIGLTLTFRTSRRISRGLAELNAASQAIGSGDFTRTLETRSRDEIGTLAESLNRMGSMLEKSYGDLERRVRERTSELEKLASENAGLYREAKEALQARDEFLSIASHELKTPLSSLLLQLQLIVRSFRDKQNKSGHEPHEWADKAVNQARRLTALIEELLDLTRIRAGKLELNPEKCDLKAIVEESIAPLGTDAALKRVPIRTHLSSPVIGVFDPLRMGQVMTNLLSNAIKYGEGKPIDISVETVGAYARIEVRDQGTGIAPDMQDFIFERFERAVVDNSISGLGLGLYITRQILEAHGGSISVKSDLGQGSVFIVLVPLNGPNA